MRLDAGQRDRPPPNGAIKNQMRVIFCMQKGCNYYVPRHRDGARKCVTARANDFSRPLFYVNEIVRVCKQIIQLLFLYFQPIYRNL